MKMAKEIMILNYYLQLLKKGFRNNYWKEVIKSAKLPKLTIDYTF